MSGYCLALDLVGHRHRACEILVPVLIFWYCDICLIVVRKKKNQSIICTSKEEALNVADPGTHRYYYHSLLKLRALGLNGS